RSARCQAIGERLQRPDVRIPVGPSPSTLHRNQARTCFQNVILNPNCITRAGPALVMRPTVAELMFETGLFRLTLLNALKASARNCRLADPGNSKLRKSDRSAFLNPGPVMKFRRELPSVPSEGTAKAAGLKYIAINSERGRSVGR